MPKIFRIIKAHLPRRRRRFWRYVSPRRHGVGALFLALLALLVYGYWYQTNGRRVRRKTENYLEELTGGPVDIQRAHFSFFGGIELNKVQLYLPGRRRAGPFFEAAKVVMKHHPWSLMVGGRVHPFEIACIEPTVTLEYNTETGTYNLKEFFELVRSKRTRLAGRLDAGLELPRIRVHEGRLRAVDVTGDQRQQVGEVPIEIIMTPTGLEYEVVFEESGRSSTKALQGRVVVDLESGRVTQIVGTLPLESLEKALPMRYRRWSRRYKLAGRINLARKELPDKGNVLVAQLADVRMQFPQEEGGLQLAGVHGELIFDNDGVDLADISGRIPQAGNCRVEMSGRYRGYAETAPFDVTMSIVALSLPDSDALTGKLADALAGIRRAYQPDGAIDLIVKLYRSENGKVSYEGTGRPRGMAMLYEQFPYRVEDVRGLITFKPGLIEFQGLTARRGRARLKIDGLATTTDGRTYYDLKVEAKDVPLDEGLRRAIPDRFRGVWSALDPAGRIGMNAHIFRGPEHEHQQIELHIAMDGKGSIKYAGFPYRIEQLIGDAYIKGRDARIENVRATRGPASCTINGVLQDVGTDETIVSLRVNGKNLPLDDVLAKAAGDLGAKSYEWLRPTGFAEKFTARVWKRPGEKLDYRVIADLEDVIVTPRDFPYRVSDMTGLATVRPGVFALENARGTHDQATVRASGEVYLSGQDVRLDLSISAESVTIDEDVQKALPPGLRPTWNRLSPSGLADVTLKLSHNPPDAPGSTDYRFVLDARDMKVTCSDFPYPLKGVTGRVVAVPGKVVLEKLFAKSGDMRGQLEGTFLYSDQADQAELVLSAVNVPVDSQLLDAIPREFAPLVSRFQPAGTCDIDLRRLSFYKPRSSSKVKPDPAEVSRAALWNVHGSAAIRNGLVDIGMGPKKVTGRIEGSGQRSELGLAMDADLSMSEVVAGKHRVTDLRGKLIKAPNSDTMTLEKFSAKLHGGRVAGSALLDMSGPLRYRLELLVDSVDLTKVFAAGENLAGDDASGLLEGRIELSDTTGEPEARRASGILRLNQARLYGKVPVLLDLLTVVYLAVPGEATFTEGECLYHLKGDTLTLSEIYLRGPTLSLVGSGTVSMKSKKLDLHFLTGPPGQLPRLAGLADEVLTGIFRELMEIEITGTLSDPKMRTRTLGSLEDTIRKLLAPTATQ